VGGDQDLGIETRRKDNISVANGDAKEDIEVEKRLKELDAVLERLSFYGDDRNLRLCVQGRWIGGPKVRRGLEPLRTVQ